MDQQLRIRVLGGLELDVNGRPLVELTSAKAAALLVYLAVTGTGHSRSALAGLLWTDLPEASARANLRLALTTLRRVLPELLDVTRQAVSLAAGRPVWVDAVEVGRMAVGDPDDAGLGVAVRLCGGEFLEGFAVPGAPLFDDWVAGRRPAVRADMIALMERAVRRARDLEDAGTGIEVTRRMLGLEPLDEEAHRALMWFLARAGQPRAALAQYETCRYLLREELGIEPSATTVALRDEITRAGEVTRRTGGHAASATVRDRSASSEVPTPSSKVPTPDLPRPLTTLVGRDEELTRLHAFLDDSTCRLVTLVGPGGIGKTRLALELAATRRSRHRDGAVFVSFVGAAPARPGEAGDLVVAGLARALGVSMAVQRDPQELLAEHLAGLDLLLVLDTLEHLREAGGVLAELLRAAPGLQLLVTSRRRLGLGVEWLVEVPGLAFPPPEADGDAAGYAAVQLFEERARLLRPGGRSAADADAVALICRLVAGLPLAVELAAHWVRSAGPAAIAARLVRGLDLLQTTSPDVEPRHRSLRVVLDWSYQLLTDEERHALHRLSVLRRGFDLDAAAAVAGVGLPLLAGLVDQSLVTVGEDGRYGMHEMLRQYAAERLAADPGQEAMARRRHAQHFAGLVAAAAPAGLVGRHLDADAENLRTATAWLIREGDPAALDAHLQRLWALYRRLGWFREAQAFLASALERPDLTALQRARSHRMLGEAFEQLGEASSARHHLERALGDLGSRVPRSTPGWLGMLCLEVTRRALRRLSSAAGGETRADRRDEAWERAAVRFTINEVYWVLEEHLPVLPNSVASLTEAERSGDVDLVARTRAGMAMISGTIGRHRSARRHLDAARAAAERTGDPVTACWLGILGGLHGIGVGDWAAVDDGAAAALMIQRPAPLHRLADQVLLISAVARYLTSRYAEAAASAAEGLTAGRDRSDPVVQFWALIILIETALRAHPDDPAVGEWSREATRLLPHAARIDAARLHAATARRHLAAGRPAEAWRAIRAADGLIGRSVEQYALEAHAGVPEVCLALLERSVDGRSSGASEPIPADVRAVATGAVHRLRGYARSHPMARPRALVCAGLDAWLSSRPRAAERAWTRALHEAERMEMPYEVARAHDELGRHLTPGRRSLLGLDRAQHLDRAIAGYRDAGCAGDLVRVRALAEADDGASVPAGRHVELRQRRPGDA